MVDSLWGDEFIIPETKKVAKKIVDKISKPKDPSVVVKKAVKSKTVSVKEKLAIIKENVLKILGKYVDNTLVIKTREQLTEYIDRSILNGVIAVDTETNNSLDPITCKLMGPCLYTPGLKNAYIPLNHVNPNTLERLDWQLTEEDVKEELDRLTNTKIIMHNGKFDYSVIKCTTGLELSIYWDTMIGAKVLDENEKSAGLKQQYIDKIDSSQEKYSIDHLFEGIEYALVDPDIFALYAATDSYMTYRLYEWQKERFELPGHERLFNMFKTVEMPLVEVIAEMELKGLEVDQEYAKLLSAKFHKRLDTLDLKIAAELATLKNKIAEWRLTEDANFHPLATKPNKNGEYLPQKSKSEQLEDPINLASPTQLAILFYDILKCPPVDKKKPRGTGEDELKAIAEKLKLPICDLLVQRRGLVKLITTYIDVIPELSKRWPDGRVRTHFNAYGAATGRLSSSEPLNFQNIPAHEKSIRLLFKAKDGYRICGGDYSAQEPRLTAFYSQDESMIQAYLEGKDLYSVIASMSFDRKYEDCLEFYPEGTEILYEGKPTICGYKTHQNKEGKSYRNMAKSILLGVLYGRGAKSVGEQIGKTMEEAQEIINKFFNAFPKVQKWINGSMDNAHKYGYVEDIAGRRRRLPDIQLPKYTIKDLNAQKNEFNPILGAENLFSGKDNPNINKYRDILSKITYRRDYEKIKEQALKENIEIHDNSGFIAQAERQAVNSRVQGGAATLTKNALITIHNDKRLRELGAYLVNTVHDEILIEVPETNSKLAEKYLVEDMVESAKKLVTNVPMKCDTYNVNCWYIDEYFTLVESDFKKLLKEGMTPEAAFEQIAVDRCESTRSQLYEIVGGYLDNIPPGVDTDYKSFTKIA